MFSLNRCSKADDQDPSKCETATTTPVKKIDKDYYITQAGTGSGRKDFSGYSIYGQYPIERLEQRKSLTFNGYVLKSPRDAPTSIEIPPSCRSYPESDSPFNSAKIQQGELVIDSNYRQANYFEPNHGEDNQCSYRKVSYDQYDRITKYYDADKAYGTKVCIGPDIQGTDIEGKSCEYDADCTLIKPTSNDPGKRGTCQFAKKVSTHYGWRGYCLERDLSKPIVGTDQYACSTWYPIDLIRGEQDIYSSHPEAGIVPNPYFCISAKVESEKVIRRIEVSTAEGSGPEHGIQTINKADDKALQDNPVDERAVSVLAIDRVDSGEEQEEWPDIIGLTRDKVNQGKTQRYPIRVDGKTKEITYKFDVKRSENTTEWMVYPVQEDGTIPEDIHPIDLGSFVPKDTACSLATGITDQNCIWAAFVFDNRTHELIQIRFAGNDEKGNNSPLGKYHIKATLNPLCDYIANVTAPQTNNILNTKNNFTISELKYSRQTKVSKENGGVGFGQLALTNSLIEPFFVSKDGNLGSPYGCGQLDDKGERVKKDDKVIDADCVSTPASIWPTNILKGLNLSQSIGKIKEIFKKAINVLIFNSQTGSYDSKSSLNWNETSGENPIISPAVLKANDPLSRDKFCVGSETGDCTIKTTGTFAVNGHGGPSTSTPVQVTKGDVVNISFFAYNENGEQMPIRRISIDWGDGPPDVSEGYYRNRKEKCRPSSDDPNQYNWGDSPVACEEIPWRFGHVYDIPKDYKIKIKVVDNWGFNKDNPENDRGTTIERSITVAGK